MKREPNATCAHCVANPDWFLRDGAAFLIFGKPGRAELATIARHPRVALTLEATADQEQTTALTGAAEVAEASSVGRDARDRCAARYADRLPGIGMTRERSGAAHSVVVRFAPDKLPGW